MCVCVRVFIFEWQLLYQYSFRHAHACTHSRASAHTKPRTQIHTHTHAHTQKFALTRTYERTHTLCRRQLFAGSSRSDFTGSLKVLVRYQPEVHSQRNSVCCHSSLVNVLTPPIQASGIIEGGRGGESRRGGVLVQ